MRADPTKTTLLLLGVAVTTFGVLCFGADALGCGEEDFVTAGSRGP